MVIPRAVDNYSVYGMIASMDDLEFVRSELQKVPLKDLDRLAELSRVPFGTLQKIKYGETADPRYTTVKLLAEHFRSKEAAA